MDATNRVNDLIVITTRLAALLERENQSLRDKKNQYLNEILDEKVTLGRVYESRIMGLTDNPDVLNEVDIDLRENLRTIGEKVNGLIEENSQLLKIAIEANRRVVNLIAEAVRDSAPSTGTYSSAGIGGAMDNNGAPRNVAISIDHTL